MATAATRPTVAHMRKIEKTNIIDLSTSLEQLAESERFFSECRVKLSKAAAKKQHQQGFFLCLQQTNASSRRRRHRRHAAPLMTVCGQSAQQSAVVYRFGSSTPPTALLNGYL